MEKGKKGWHQLPHGITCHLGMYAGTCRAVRWSGPVGIDSINQMSHTLVKLDTILIRTGHYIYYEWKCPCYYGKTLHWLDRKVSFHSGGRTRIVHLAGELGFVIEPLLLGPQALDLGLWQVYWPTLICWQVYSGPWCTWSYILLKLNSSV